MKGKLDFYVCDKCERVIITILLHEGRVSSVIECPYCRVGHAHATLTNYPGASDAEFGWVRRADHDNQQLTLIPLRAPITSIIPQRQPNPASCLITSFAMVLGVPVVELIEQIGHDGTEIIFPALEPPYCYRAHHIQELIFLCLERGYAVTCFEPMPTLAAKGYELILPNPKFEKCLLMRYGVLVGETHAVAWGDHRCYNPTTGLIIPIEEFKIKAFYAITPHPEKLYSSKSNQSC